MPGRWEPSSAVNVKLVTLTRDRAGGYEPRIDLVVERGQDSEDSRKPPMPNTIPIDLAKDRCGLSAMWSAARGYGGGRVQEVREGLTMGAKKRGRPNHLNTLEASIPSRMPFPRSPRGLCGLRRIFPSARNSAVRLKGVGGPRSYPWCDGVRSRIGGRGGRWDAGGPGVTSPRRGSEMGEYAPMW
jgi:hypothetical protein